MKAPSERTFESKPGEPNVLSGRIGDDLFPVILDSGADNSLVQEEAVPTQLLTTQQ